MLFRSDRKSTRLNSSHTIISYAVFCLKKKKKKRHEHDVTITYVDAVIHTDHTVRALVSLCGAVLPQEGSSPPLCRLFFFFFFNDTATTEIYTLSLHDALPISAPENDSAESSAERTVRS